MENTEEYDEDAEEYDEDTEEYDEVIRDRLKIFRIFFRF